MPQRDAASSADIMPQCGKYISYASCGTWSTGKNNNGNYGRKLSVRYCFNTKTVTWNNGHGITDMTKCPLFQVVETIEEIITGITDSLKREEMCVRN